MSDYQYTVPTDQLDDYIDKMTRGIMPMVDDVTYKEIEIRMHELASEISDYDEEDEEVVETLKQDVKEIQARVKDNKRKASRTDIAIFTLNDEQKATLRRQMSSSFVRKEPSLYNTDEETEKVNKEYQTLRKRASKIRRCYYHADEWINAVKTLLALVEYDKRNYPWYSDEEYYKAFWTGTIKLDVICPILYLDYHTPIKDPELLVGIFNGEISIEEEPSYDLSKRVKSKDDTVVKVAGGEPFTNAEIDYMTDMASRGYVTPINILLKNQHKSLYDRFMPTSKTRVDASRVQSYLSYVNEGMKVKDHRFEPYSENDIIGYIHAVNNGTLNTALNSNTSKFLAALGTVQETKVDLGFKTSDTLVNAEAAIREASIMANIKSLNGMT